jgi:hypothetical protein
MGFQVRLTETNLSEIAATTAPERRDKLIALCRHLNYHGECIRPYNWIIEQLSKEHARNPAHFDWTWLAVRGPELEEELTRSEFLGTSELAEEILADFEAHSDRFEKIYGDARPAFDRIFEGKQKQRPPISKLVEALKADNGAFWRLGMGMYRRACGREIDEAGMQAFLDACPPFNAALLSLCVAQFHRCIRHVRAKADYKAGRLDLFQAVYLPYCDSFITNDEGQRNSFAFVAAEGGLTTEVCRFAEFQRGWLVSA